MSKLNTLIALNLVAAIFAAPSLAGDDKKGNPSRPQKGVSFEEFKDRCAHPEQFNDVQRPPQNIKVQCTDTRHVWVAGAPGEITLPGVRKVNTGIMSDKFFVALEEASLNVAAGAGTCHRFKQVEESITIERDLTCGEILGIKGNLAEYCGALADSTKGGNPKLVNARDTGAVIDTCGASNDNGKGGKGKKLEEEEVELF